MTVAEFFKDEYTCGRVEIHTELCDDPGVTGNGSMDLSFDEQQAKRILDIVNEFDRDAISIEAVNDLMRSNFILNGNLLWLGIRSMQVDRHFTEEGKLRNCTTRIWTYPYDGRTHR